MAKQQLTVIEFEALKTRASALIERVTVVPATGAVPSPRGYRMPQIERVEIVTTDGRAGNIYFGGHPDAAKRNTRDETIDQDIVDCAAALASVKTLIGADGGASWEDPEGRPAREVRVWRDYARAANVTRERYFLARDDEVRMSGKVVGRHVVIEFEGQSEEEVIEFYLQKVAEHVRDMRLPYNAWGERHEFFASESRLRQTNPSALDEWRREQRWQASRPSAWAMVQSDDREQDDH